MISHKCELKIFYGNQILEKPEIVNYRNDHTPVVQTISNEFVNSQGG
jgi:hypothetical protein